MCLYICQVVKSTQVEHIISVFKNVDDKSWKKYFAQYVIVPSTNILSTEQNNFRLDFVEKQIILLFESTTRIKFSFWTVLI